MPDEPEYEASPSRTDRTSTSKPLAIGAVLVLILAAALVWRFTQRSPQEEVPPPVPAASAPSAESTSRPEPPAPLTNLPPLDASDPTVRQHLLPLSSAPEWA